MHVRHFLNVLMIMTTIWATPGIGAVTDGVMDLSSWDGSSFLSLDGTWMSIEDELVGGAHLSRHSLTPIPVPTPGEFHAESGHGRYQRSYILRIKGLRIDRPVALLSQGMAIWSQNFIFYQDETGLQYELGQVGKVDPDPRKRLHLYTGGVSIALPRIQGDGTLIVQTNANPFYQGVLHPYRQTARLEIGPADQVMRKAQRQLSEQSFTLGLFALMMLFNLALFIQRPQERSTLYLAGMTLAFTWRFICTDGYLPKVMDHTHNLFVFTTAGVTFSTHLATFFLALFLRATYPKQVPAYIPAIFIVIFGIMFINLTTASLYDLQNRWVQYMLALIPLAFYLCFLSLRAALAGEEGATLGIFGLGSVFIGHINDFMVATNVYDSIYLGHYSLVLLIFTQSLVVGRRFALTFKRTLLLGRELQVKNEALVKQQAEIQTLNQSLKEYAETLEHKVEEKTRDIVSILNNIRQGIVAVQGPDGALSREHSLYLETMFDIRKTEGLNVLDVCFSGSNVSSDQLDQLRNALSMIIGEDALAFEMNQAALPTEISRTDGQGHQFLELDWSPVIAGTHIEKLLLVMRDVTEIKRLRLEAEDQAAELKLIADIINVPKERFEGLMAATERLVEANRDLLARLAHLDGHSVDRLYRNLHTVKGMMRGYQLREVTEMVHTAENRYKAIKAGSAVDPSILMEDLEKILALVRRMAEINRQKLGRSSIHDHQYILIDKRQFEENLRTIREIDIQMLQADDQSRFESIRKLFFKVAYAPLSKVLESQLEGLPHLARSLNKNPPHIEFMDQGFSINREIHEAINNIFTHLLRNSIDHGLETGKERIAKGKAPAGMITFKSSLFHGQLRIEYSDDGAGIDLQKIRSKAIEKGLLRPDQDVSRQDLVDFILQPGFSTSERVTDISGRGVGMDAVRAFVEEIDGTFEIKIDEPGSPILKAIPALFVIILPENRFQNMEMPDSHTSSRVA